MTTRFEVYARYRAKRDEARIEFDRAVAEATREISAKFDASIALLKAERQASLKEIPKQVSSPRNVERTTATICATCHQDHLVPNRANSEALCKALGFSTWQGVLISLKKRRICCFHCSTTGGRVHGHYCLLPERLDEAQKEGE